MFTLKDEYYDDDDDDDDAWLIRLGGIGLLVIGGWVMLFLMLTGGFQKEKRVFT